VVVDECFLDAVEEAVLASRVVARVDLEKATFLSVGVVVVGGQGQAELEILRLKRRIALDQRRAKKDGLGEQELVCVAKDVRAVGVVELWMPTGTGVERGSTTVSEIAVNTTNQSSPKTGLSPLRVFWLYGSHQFSGTPRLSSRRQRSGTGMKSGGKLLGGGPGTAFGSIGGGGGASRGPEGPGRRWSWA
jgi:hypothetical protein